MKIALISDIHANLFALEAVLAHAENQGVKQIWCMGDFVHFNAFPQEVVKTIRKLDGTSICGNVDLDVLKMRKMIGKKKLEELPEDKQFLAWSYLQLSKKSREFLADLPKTKRIIINGNRFLLVHGSPVAVDDPIYLDTPEERLRELIKLTNAEFIICGHTHAPFVREVDGITFINPGSVGKPLDGDSRACYSIMNVKKNSVSVEPYRVEYDLSQALLAMKEIGQPELYIHSLELSISQDKYMMKREAEKLPEVTNGG